MEESGGDAPTEGESAKASVGQRRGIISRIWRGIFGVRNEDFEKKLQHLSKEEAAVHARMKRRAQSSRKRAKNLIMLSMSFEVVAVAIAVIAIKSLDFTGPMKFFRTLPAILLPGFSYVVYSLLETLTRMLDRRDEKTLERLRGERKAKIDELKERTNYYSTQQLIQRYDLDPAAKVAAASSLASRLGAESGLKFRIGDDEPSKSSSGCMEQPQSGGVVRQRKQQPSITSNDVGSKQQVVHGDVHLPPTSPLPVVIPMVVEHYSGSATSDGGWISRLAAMFVGDDPSQCYALICGNCHKHNGLGRKEDFPHITYYCPHCHALNTSKQIGDQDLRSLRPALISPSSSVTSSSDEGAERIQELTESAAAAAASH